MRASWRRALAWLAVAAVVIVAFLPALDGEFVSWDDYDNFVLNQAFRGLGWQQIRWAWTTALLGHYVPLTWMSLELDYVMWGMTPRGYHLTSVIIHAANAVLVGVLASKLIAISESKPSRGPLFAAALAALFFAVHPLRVESVAWVTERRDVLSLFFVLLAVLAYLRSAEDGHPHRRRAYVTALLLFLAALLAKASAMSVPAALFLLNVYPLRRLPTTDGWFGASARRVLLEIAPFFALSAAASLLSVRVLQPGAQLPVGGKIAVSAYSLVFYILKTAVPVNLAPLYQMPVTVTTAAPVYIACYAIIAILAGALWRIRRRVPAAPAAFGIFVALILPMLGVVQNGPQIAADRYTYMASIPLALLAAVGVERLPGRMRYAVAALLVVLLGTLTWKQSRYWRDSSTLWSRVLQVDSTSYYALNNVGVFEAKRGNSAEAIRLYERAIELGPRYADTYNNLGFELLQQGRVDTAIALCRKALALQPQHVNAEINLGTALLVRENYEEAIVHFARAEPRAPDLAGLHYNWAVALMRLNRLSEARARVARALELDPQRADAQALYARLSAAPQRPPR